MRMTTECRVWVKTARLLLGVITGLSLTGTAAALEPYTAQYGFNIDNRWSGESSRVLRKDGADWVYTFTARVPVLANATETTRFSIDDQRNVISKNHNMRYKIVVRNKNLAMNFDAASRKINVDVGGKKSVLEFKAGTLDELNLEFQVREDLKKGALQPQYLVADEKRVEAVRFVREGREQLSVPAGRYDTVRVRRVHNNPKRTTTFWLAPSLDYLPVRVMQNDDGTVYDFTLSRFTAN
ncbi:MAG: DUF3108 domain-containing protein [Moraxellaceae bacterium]